MAGATALRSLHVGLIASQAYDVYRRRTQSVGRHRMNPLLKDTVRSRFAFVAIKVAVTAGPIYEAEKLWRKNQNRRNRADGGLQRHHDGRCQAQFIGHEERGDREVERTRAAFHRSKPAPQIESATRADRARSRRRISASIIDIENGFSRTATCGSPVTVSSTMSRWLVVTMTGTACDRGRCWRPARRARGESVLDDDHISDPGSDVGHGPVPVSSLEDSETQTIQVPDEWNARAVVAVGDEDPRVSARLIAGRRPPRGARRLSGKLRRSMSVTI